MSKKERVKTDLDILKNLLSIVITAIFGLFGYVLVNYSNLDKAQIIIGSVISVILYFALIVLVLQYLKNRRNLEEMK